MICTFGDRDTEKLFNDFPVARFRNFERVARRKLLLLHAASSLESLKSPPGNHLELLRGDRVGLHSIRINDQWRICFRWTEAGAFEVEIGDYH